MGLDTVELVVTIENKFGIHIPDKDCQKINTVQDFVDIVCEIKEVNDDVSKEKVQKIVVETISYCLGIPIDEIKLKHSITNDLGID